MVNSQKLKGRITEKGYTNQTLAPEIPCSPYTLGQKINNEKSFWLTEVEKLCLLLDISEEEFSEFFLQK